MSTTLPIASRRPFRPAPLLLLAIMLVFPVLSAAADNSCGPNCVVLASQLLNLEPDGEKLFAEFAANGSQPASFRQLVVWMRQRGARTTLLRVPEKTLAELDHPSIVWRPDRNQEAEGHFVLYRPESAGAVTVFDYPFPPRRRDVSQADTTVPALVCGVGFLGWRVFWLKHRVWPLCASLILACVVALFALRRRPARSARAGTTPALSTVFCLALLMALAPSCSKKSDNQGTLEVICLEPQPLNLLQTREEAAREIKFEVANRGSVSVKAVQKALSCQCAKAGGIATIPANGGQLAGASRRFKEDGKIEAYKYDPSSGIAVTEFPDGRRLERQYILSEGPAFGKTRTHKLGYPDGELTETKNFFDDAGNMIRQTKNQK